MHLEESKIGKKVRRNITNCVTNTSIKGDNMSFKFSLLDFKFNNCNCEKGNKKIKSSKNRFTNAVQICHQKTKNKNDFGDCMSRELKK